MKVLGFGLCLVLDLVIIKNCDRKGKWTNCNG